MVETTKQIRLFFLFSGFLANDTANEIGSWLELAIAHKVGDKVEPA